MLKFARARIESARIEIKWGTNAARLCNFGYFAYRLHLILHSLISLSDQINCPLNLLWEYLICLHTEDFFPILYWFIFVISQLRWFYFLIYANLFSLIYLGFCWMLFRCDFSVSFCLRCQITNIWRFKLPFSMLVTLWWFDYHPMGEWIGWNVYTWAVGPTALWQDSYTSSHVTPFTKCYLHLLVNNAFRKRLWTG